MTNTTTSPHADFEHLRQQAVALRRQGFSLREISDALGVRSKDVLSRLVRGEPPAERTRRHRTKDDLRERARELRRQGMTYDEIKAELGCSKSSVSLWVRDLPKPERRPASEQAKLAARKRWEHERERREEDRRHSKQTARQAVGDLSERELFLTGVVLYWAEGAKDKAYARRERIHFVNSDPNVIRLFLRWLALLGVSPDRLRFRVSIHESADVGSAERFWANVAGVDVSALQKANLKRHNPKTVRKNTDDAYRGCLLVYVTRSAELYRRTEGAWYGIVGAASATDHKNRT
ncbi:hypothetical protein [Streptomyces sp. CC77]|uniref:hypothetical protein n=1 Tax=Streptomyces sp. CC77 TaxID=1906739 RepID=UPI0008DD14A8|nr:hypothetical protein [Streptomyces sp. CC77]OII66919.1 hypothetical protein BJP39_26740 [Streptomyces sp. CC77]